MELEEVRNMIMCAANEMNHVFVCGGENITHMDVAMQMLNQATQKCDAIIAEQQKAEQEKRKSEQKPEKK